MVKWIAAIIGYFLSRSFFGGIIGFFLGSVIDESLSGGKSNNGRRTVFSNQRASTTVSPADFELHLISLCSIVIKADGSVSQKELDYVRRYFISTYGKERANHIFRTFNEVVKQREVSAQRIAGFLNPRTRYEVRLQLLHFLFGIADADGAVSDPEASKLREIASYFKIGRQDFESIMAMFVRKTDHAYRILEIESNATDDEVKKAYRNMAKKYHPDRVNTEDEAIKKGAEEKFKQVQLAYEEIQKERDIN